MAWPSDKLVGIDPTIPRDTDPESSLGQVVRDLKMALRDWALVEHWLTGKQKRPFATDLGTVANTYIVQLDHEITELDAGFMLAFIPNYSNTGASTIEITCFGVNIGTYAIRFGGSALTTGLITADKIALICFDGTNFELVNAGSSSISGGGGTGQFYIDSQEGTYSYVSHQNDAQAELGSIILPPNSYDKILVTGQFGIRCAMGSSSVYRFQLLKGGTPIVDKYVKISPFGTLETIEFNQFIDLSSIFDGGQTSNTELKVVLALAGTAPTSDKSGGLLLNLRLYGYEV